MARPRLRELGITIGNLPTGPNNAITDVPGVWVGHSTLIRDEPRIARTGVTVIAPRMDGELGITRDAAFAGFHVFSGNGEMTGLPWLDETGLLVAPIAITNTNQVGMARDALSEYIIRQDPDANWVLPVAAETWDGVLNDINAFHLNREHVFEALANARSGPVTEGNIGGGTGMICHDFKAGIGTSSRVVDTICGDYTVGALVQANYGDRHQLRIDGVSVGDEIDLNRLPTPRKRGGPDGSIIAVVATDAPLLSTQCFRLAQRATVGMARVGGIGHHSSGDLFLAFATGNHVPTRDHLPIDLKMIPQHHIDPFFEAAAEAVEEAILNALTAAETMMGFQGRTAYAIPIEELQRIMDADR